MGLLKLSLDKSCCMISFRAKIRAYPSCINCVSLEINSKIVDNLEDIRRYIGPLEPTNTIYKELYDKI
jgi:hypothetical protein